MEEKIVKLPSRYNINNYLELLEGSTYLLHTEDDTVRVGYNEDNSIYFVDPPGGPFLPVGKVIEGIGTIESISPVEGGFKIRFV